MAFFDGLRHRTESANHADVHLFADELRQTLPDHDEFAIYNVQPYVAGVSLLADWARLP